VAGDPRDHRPFLQIKPRVNRDLIMFQKLCQATVLTLTVALIGCGSGGDFADTVPVSGTINLGGAPLAGAKVTFVVKGTEGRSASGLTDDSGKFKLTTFDTDDGAIPGDYVVTVSIPKADPESDAIDISDGDGDFGEAYEAGMENASEGGKTEDVYARVPSKYGQPATSGLDRTVGKSGKNEFTIDLVE
jgi:hypothetical protein